MKEPRRFEFPEEKYIISESDIMDILIAYNNQDYEWIIFFFETLVPVQRVIKQIKVEPTYTFNEILKTVGLKVQGT